MITAHCAICNLELGQASVEVRIVCPSCGALKRHVMRLLRGESAQAPFPDWKWFHDVQGTKMLNHDMVLEITRSGFGLDDFLNNAGFTGEGADDGFCSNSGSTRDGVA